MIPFFSSDDNWKIAQTAINSWMGTPYRHMWMRKGRGISCSILSGVILVEVGVLSKIEFSNHPLDWFLHTRDEIIKEEFSKNILNWVRPGLKIIEIPGLPFDFMRGDIVGFSTVPTTGVTNHTGMLLDPPTNFVHSIHKHGVNAMYFGSYWKDKTICTYRVLEI